MQSTLLELDTSSRCVVDLTDEAMAFCRSQGDGLLQVFVPHATAGVAIIETGSGSEADLVDALDRLLPRSVTYRHAHGSPGHGADHVLPALVSPSLTVPVEDGDPLLGTWQRIVLIDLNADNPSRAIRLSFLPRVTRTLLVAVAGASGAVLRYRIGVVVGVRSFPWATLAINLTGCFVLAFVLTGPGPRWSTATTTAVTVGLLGAYTTYSTFGYETFTMLRTDRVAAALVYVGLSLAGGLLATGMGYLAARAL